MIADQQQTHLVKVVQKASAAVFVSVTHSIRYYRESIDHGETDDLEVKSWHKYNKVGL